MLKNYLTIAIRNLLRNKTYSFINIAGLAVGLAVFILVALFVGYQISYDRFHEKADRMYRVIYGLEREGEVSYDFGLPIAMIQQVQELPEVEELVQLSNPSSRIVQAGTERFFAQGAWAGSSLFDAFSFSLLQGNPREALARPYTVVITEDLAARSFRAGAAIGETLMIDGENYEVTGFLADIPANSQLQFELLISYSSVPSMPPQYLDLNRVIVSTRVYLALSEGTSPQALEERLAELLAVNRPDNIDPVLSLSLQPFTQSYLHSAHIGERGEGLTRLQTVYLLSVLAFLVLLIAGFNFVNMATAGAVGRSKEVGVRKVVGAGGLQLTRQYITESLVVSFFALGLALVMVSVLLPSFNVLVQSDLSMAHLQHGFAVLAIIGFTILVGILAGIYPGLVLARFRPTAVLQGNAGSSGRSFLRRVLVTAQFGISILLLICTVFIIRQVRFAQKADLGFNREQVVHLPIMSPSVSMQFDAIKNELLQLPGVVSVAGASDQLGFELHDRIYEAGVLPPSAPDQIHYLLLDTDYFDLFELEMVSGRALSPEYAADVSDPTVSGPPYEISCVLNETAVRAFGWDEPLGQQIWIDTGPGLTCTVVGVVKDFHHESLHTTVTPTALIHNPGAYQNIYMRIQPESASLTLAAMKEVWDRLVADQPFAYAFLDEQLDNLYGSEARLGSITTGFTFLAVFISCLGLFGLASLAATRRTKEIGIRKVVGASITQVVTLLSKEFLVLVLIANVIAWPIAWYAMRRWLQNFAYRIDLGLGVFILAGLLALVIALATVSWQTVRAATANPVEALRYE